MKFQLTIFIFLFFLSSIVKAQNVSDDSTLVYILEPTQRQRTIKQADGTDLQILAGTVKLRQGNTIFYTDSCVVNTSTKVFEAFGNVHINDSDTTHIYSDYLRYLTNKRYAYFKNNVRLTDGHGTLTTNDLEYDVASNIGIYKNGGKVLNKTSVLTSKDGVYYADVRDVYFRNNVELKDPAYYLKSDSMIYNTESQTARFIAETFIRDSSGSTIQTSEGFYDLRG